MSWRDHVDARVVEDARRDDPELDIDSLGRELEPRIMDGRIRKPSTVFAIAAREARTLGKHRLPGATRTPLDALADMRVHWYASAARGATAVQIADAVERVADRFPSAGLLEEARALRREPHGWPVPRGERDEDLPSR